MKIYSVIHFYKDSSEKDQCIAVTQGKIWARMIKAFFASYDRSKNRFPGSYYRIVESEIDDSLVDIFSNTEQK